MTSSRSLPPAAQSDAYAAFSSLALDNRLLQALEKLSFDVPTPVQAAAIPAALTGKDLLVSAETGSGKTAAFVLPVLHRLLQKTAEAGQRDNTGTRALILVPTRELAIQVVKQCDKLARCSHLKSGLIIGGNSFKYQQALLRKNPEIIVATPGRIAEHITHKSIDLNDLEVLVLDEADRMLDLGLNEDVRTIAKHCNTSRQTFLFSATLTHRAFAAIIDNILKEPEVIKLNQARSAHSNIEQQIILADDAKHKDELLDALLSDANTRKVLVFTNTRAEASRICGVMQYRKHRAGLLHGEISQDERNAVMNRLRGNNISILVATDVAARGLDVDAVDLVVNYDMPRSGTDYTHRVGRTGRAGSKGLAVSLVSASEWNLMSSIERYLKIRFSKRKIDGLEAGYKGPKKLKKSGKAAGSKLKKKKKNTAKGKTTKQASKSKTKSRSNQGLSPPKKRI